MSRNVVVVGSINVDLYRRLDGGAVSFGGKDVPLTPIKGMTLPAKSFLANAAIDASCRSAGLTYSAGGEEALVLTLDGPFVQKTGGKGANAAAAAGQTFACALVGNFGMASSKENDAIFSDLKTYGNVDVARCAHLPGVPTGTAYILMFDDNDNAILLIGGANQQWPAEAALTEGDEGAKLRESITGSLCVMLQREVPEYVNVVSAKLAHAAGVPVFMDVGGTDAPLDEALLPYICVVAPNESELTFIAGVSTQDDDGKIVPSKLRAAVAALKAKFAAKGNASVEVLVTLGAQGSCYFESAWTLEAAPAMENRVGSFQLSSPGGEPRDTTGAGDCFRGSFVGARYGEGKSIADAMRWAAAASSISVEVEGAMPSMPTREKIVERLAQTMRAQGEF